MLYIIKKERKQDRKKHFYSEQTSKDADAKKNLTQV